MVQNMDTYSHYVGDGSQNEYTFDFYITDLADLLVIITDDEGEVVSSVRGDDTVVLDGVELNNSFFLNGGTVTLASNLTDDYNLWLILAPDEPIQETRLRDQSDWSLETIERAFDYVISAIQRISVLARKSIRLPEDKLIEDFDMTIPKEFLETAGATLIMNEDLNGLEVGPTADEISSAQTNATAAAASASSASNSATAAAESAAAAAASEAAAEAAAGAAIMEVLGSRNSPILVTTSIPFTVDRLKDHTKMYIKGDSAAVTLTGNPRIGPGNRDGQELTLIGVDDAHYVEMSDGQGVSNGNITKHIINDTVLTLTWDDDGSKWIVKSDNGI